MTERDSMRRRNNPGGIAHLRQKVEDLQAQRNEARAESARLTAQATLAEAQQDIAVSALKRMKEYHATGSPCWRYCDEALARIAEIGKDAPASKCLTATEVMRAQANPFGRWVWVPETTQEEG